MVEAFHKTWNMLVEFWEPKNDISITSKKLISNKVLTNISLT